jgi:hypothetical protein
LATSAAVALALALAGCGGGGRGAATSTEQVEGQRVAGPGFVFSAPSAWHVSRGAREVTVRPGGNGPTLASVTVLELRSAYKPSLFPKVSKELDGVTRALAAKLSGKVIARRTVVVSGGRARQYDLAYERQGTGLIDRITFVLRKRAEYYVLCRWPADQGEPSACGLLQSTFRVR